MKARINYANLAAAVTAGQFCDSGHYHCPVIRDDGAIVFDAGIVRPNGEFAGASRLAAELAEANPAYVPEFGAHSEACPCGHGN